MRREGQENYGLPRNKFRLAMHGSPDIKLSDHTHVTSTPRGVVIPVVEDEESEAASINKKIKTFAVVIYGCSKVNKISEH